MMLLCKTDLHLYLQSSLQQESIDEIGFELDGVAMVINWWSNVINGQKTWYSESLPKYCPGHILREILYQHTCRRMCCIYWPPSKPNATESEFLTSGLKFPSFRYRSGRNFIGLLKTLESCNIVLHKKVRLESRNNCSLLTMHSQSQLPLSEYNSHYTHRC